MRRARIKMAAEDGAAIYHLISRTVNGEWMLGTTGKEVLRRMLWQVAEFAGLEIITYTILSNHFHILIRVPEWRPLSDQELLRRYAILYPKPTTYRTASLNVIKSQLEDNGPKAVAWREWMRGMMYDVSPYMKLVKERFSLWHNATHGRFGPVWADRFKSLMVEPDRRTIEAQAAYIDLNCVRAGIVNDPKDYRFCGYAEAVAGRVEAQRGIQSVVGGDWEAAQSAYRQLLFTKGGKEQPGRASIPLEQVRAVLKAGGTLPLPAVLRCRVRYFTEGAVIGSQAFVDLHLQRFRERTGAGQRMKGHRLPAVTDWGELVTLHACRDCLFG